MTAYTGRHALPYAEPGDGVKASRASIQSMTELVDTKLDQHAFAVNGRRVRNLATYDESVSNGTGFIVIQTNMVHLGAGTGANVMTQLHITGRTYTLNNNILDLTVTFYPFDGDGQFHNYDVKNNGTMRIKMVHLLDRTSDGRVAIALEQDSVHFGGFWEYPKIVVDGVFGHQTMPDASFKSGWSISRVANLSAYTAKRIIDPRPATMRVYAAAAQGIGNGAWTQLNQWIYDFQHPDISFSAQSFTVLRAGLYLISQSTMFRNDVSSTGVRGINIRKNGIEIAGHYSAPLAAQADYVSASVSTVWPLVYGDVINFWAMQNSGGTVNLHTGQWNHATMTLLK